MELAERLEAVKHALTANDLADLMQVTPTMIRKLARQPNCRRLVFVQVVLRRALSDHERVTVTPARYRGQHAGTGFDPRRAVGV